MFTSTIILQGKVVVQDVMFSWWVTDGATARLTVSHPTHGTETRPLADVEPRVQARGLALAMLNRKARPTKVAASDAGATPNRKVKDN